MNEYLERSQKLNDYLLAGRNSDDSGTEVSFFVSEINFSTSKFRSILHFAKNNGVEFTRVHCSNFVEKIHQNVSYDKITISNGLFEKFKHISFDSKTFFISYDKMEKLVAISVWTDKMPIAENPNYFNDLLKIIEYIASVFDFIIGFQWGKDGSLHDLNLNMDRLIDFFNNPIDNFLGTDYTNFYYFPIMFWGNEILTEKLEKKLTEAPAEQVIIAKNGIGLVFAIPGKLSLGKAKLLKNYFAGDAK
ncbi:MAG: hypothetical protein IPJ89_05180 [Candidatus Iainarchaeum archaeon]|uniref:Uncharacterized protein n=1 Tax=Candidatus Iainarchaeum sp. TaxID=3101447 RepID=A0A7T9I1K5_9ARCH|nr:MAG: hypothetical protein IPJ89_05180 [Candidatus Diapherotrites archaeon]